MSTVIDYGEWVRAPEMEFYSFTYKFAAGFKLSQSMSLKKFISSTYSNIKHKTPDFFFSWREEEERYYFPSRRRSEWEKLMNVTGKISSSGNRKRN